MTRVSVGPTCRATSSATSGATSSPAWMLRTPGVFVILALLSAGCLTTPGAEPTPIVSDERSDASMDIDAHIGPENSNDTDDPFPGFTLTLHDERDEPRDPRVSIPLRTTIRFADHEAPWPEARLHLVVDLQTDTADADGADDDTDADSDADSDGDSDTAPATWNTTLHPTGPNETLDHTIILDPRPGEHTVTVTAQWRDDHEDHDHADTRSTATLSLTRYAPMALHLDAHHAWYDDQKTFDTTYTIGVAPWHKESGLDVLDRASDIHGFPVRTTYYPDFDAHYLLGVNGTDERWKKIGPQTVGSWSWMIYYDGRLGDRAIDDYRPGQDDGLWLRYLECDMTGRCQEPPE